MILSGSMLIDEIFRYYYAFLCLILNFLTLSHLILWILNNEPTWVNDDDEVDQ